MRCCFHFLASPTWFYTGDNLARCHVKTKFSNKSDVVCTYTVNKMKDKAFQIIEPPCDKTITMTVRLTKT